MIIVYCFLFITGAYLTTYVLYDLMLLGGRFLIKEDIGFFRTPRTRFGIIIPAHNEELFLARLLQSINNQHYPCELVKTIVIADNCTDKTAEIALKNGALGLERNDELHHGKGYAIRWAIEKIDINEYDAFFIIDADSLISDDLLVQLDHAISEGKNIIQCYNGVANPDESWFTRLLNVSRTVGNEILQPAKQKLGLSSHLMGNGMCFTSEVFMKYGWDAFSVGEDWEYYAKLIQAGETVSFVSHARVYHQESSSLKQATSQRMRWSSGRFAVAWKYGIGLFLKGLVEKNIKKLDASLPLIFPNPSLGMNIAIIGLVLSSLPLIIENKHVYFVWFFSLAVMQLLMFLAGIMFTQNKLKNLLSIFIAPIFLIWKMGIDTLSAFGMGRQKWVRTERRL